MCKDHRPRHRLDLAATGDSRNCSQGASADGLLGAGLGLCTTAGSSGRWRRDNGWLVIRSACMVQYANGSWGLLEIIGRWQGR